MIELVAGELALVLDPGTGGAIAALTWRGEALLRPVADERLAAQRGRAVAAYPLIPYANRIAWGRFAWDGVEYQLARNFGDHPHVIHGNAWMRPWTVAEHAPRHARIVLDHTPPADPVTEWPFAYRAEQHFELTEEALRVTMSVRNRDDRAWPAGLGLHPYVARRPGASLRFAAPSFWTTGQDGLPEALVPVDDAHDFGGGRVLGGEIFDTCFAGWDGDARLSATEPPGLALRAEQPACFLQIYTPAGRDYLGLEPVTNMPDAINHSALGAQAGLRVLRPGETLTITVEIGVLTS